jgi:hypothetical protein
MRVRDFIHTARKPSRPRRGRCPYPLRLGHFFGPAGPTYFSGLGFFGGQDANAFMPEITSPTIRVFM